MYGNGYDLPRGPPRAGIGAQGAAQNLPAPNLGQDMGGAPSGEKYSLFMSGLPAMLEDKWLHDILESVGPVLKVNRIRDAAGKAKGFGFVEYSDAESVLRCLELVNGTSVLGRDGEQKTLAIKADAKVRERLDTYEAGRMKTSQLDAQTAFAKDTLQDIIDNIRKISSVVEPGEEEEELNPDGTKKFRIPAHLQDLGPDDLPEESRGLITREIAFFRERAAKREEANKLAEEKRNQARRQAEDQRKMQNMRQPQGGPVQGSPRMDQGRPFGHQNYPSQPRNFQGSPPPSGPASQQRSDPYQRHDDPQCYNRPVGFVASSSNQGSLQRNGMSDEDLERQRIQRERDHNDQQYHQRLSRWLTRERGKMQSLDRDKQQKYYEAQENDKRRQENLQKCSTFDDDEEAETGNELFITDRPRWRKYRQQARRREIEQDAKDAQLEAEEAAALKKDTEDFLARQAELFASMSGSTSMNADATSGEPPKLSLVAAQPLKSEAKADDIKIKPKHKPAAAFAGADEEDDGSNKKRRELIPLSYSDDEDDEKKAEKKKRKVKDLVSAIPNDKAGLWKYQVRWEKLSESMVRDRIRPFVAKKSVEYLGSEEQEVIDTVLENMRAHKGPADLSDELEPVLAEEAEEFVVKVYRHLNFELLSALHGVQL